jgi:sensor domain CHASE-containing protein
MLLFVVVCVIQVVVGSKTEQNDSQNKYSQLSRHTRNPLAFRLEIMGNTRHTEAEKYWE